ncbi:sensor histidine kinase [Allostreptomyces psammosilenae]|uniref:histidine kinase n=1 Tax=Allostreptomyces psammosilenae TaxID=1892865 RepID=A0A852ZXM0_9ACTN|nr:histidine kinase [Allostreptomyces psammosilenae]NYI05990.1 signal transduction histidine kinase [Allostreptomyces psammosilenae]
MSMGSARVRGVGGGPGGPGSGDALWWWRHRRSVALDVLLALASAAECAGDALLRSGRAGAGDDWAWAVLAALVGSLLVVRRRWPVAVALVAVVVQPVEIGLVMLVVGLYSVGAYVVERSTVIAVSGLAVAATGVVTTMSILSQPTDPGTVRLGPAVLLSVVVPLSVGSTVAPVLLGLYVGARRRLLESLRERAHRLEREQALLAEQARERAHRARVEERTRIAREMHDVVAHRVSLMVVHSGAVQAVARRDADRAVEGARLIGDMGRQALDELRQILGVLRMEEDPPSAAGPVAGGAGGVGGARAVGERAADGRGSGGRSFGDGSSGDGSAGQRPEGVPARRAREDLERLVGQSRAAGVEVSLEVSLGGGVDGEDAEHTCASASATTVFRLVQEALTNVHKHAGQARTAVRVVCVAGRLRASVVNEEPSQPPAQRLPSGGNGLTGMRERVVELGGSFEAGATAAGGFRVAAELPCGAAGA